MRSPWDNFPIERITTENGLSHNTVSSICQDSRGFIWIGTIDGLNRFDGYSCRVFKHDPADSTSVSSSFIHSIYEDKRGTLWITTRDGGLNRFDYRTETFKNYKHNPHDPASIGHNKVGGIFEDSQGRFWVTTDGGVNLFDEATGRFTRFSHDPTNPNSLSNNEVTGICEDEDGLLWFSTDNGLNRFEPLTGTFTHYSHNALRSNSLSDNRLVRVLPTRDGKLWVGTRGGGVNLLDRTTGAVSRFLPNPKDPRRPSNMFVSPIFEDAAGNIWFATHDGVNIYEPATQIFHRLPYTPNSSKGLSHNIVSSIVQDNVGDVWIGTWGGGVNRVAKRKQKFIPISSKTSGVLPNDFVLSMLTDRSGTVWVGTANGASRSDGARFAQHLLPGVAISALLEDSDGTIWAAPVGGGIKVFRPDGTLQQEFVHSRSRASSLADNTIRALFRDSRGIVWAGTQTRGVNSYDRTEPRGGEWTRFPFGATDGKSVSDGLVWAINEDADGDLWFGTYSGGLNWFDPTTTSFRYFRHDARDSTSLPADDVRCIAVTRSGELWIGTYGGGISKLDKETGRFTTLNERHGLANNFVYGILEDDDGNLWISTNKGLSRFNPRTKTFRNYTSRDGLQSDEFNTGAYFRSRNGELFFGGVAGLNRFFPNEVRDNPHVPPIVLTSFKVFDKEVKVNRSRRVGTMDSIQLHYHQNFFSFEFAALDFVDPMRNRYAYKLEGFDTEWLEAGTRRYASYTNLDPGEYLLRVKGSNNDGVWNENGAQLHITIVPPFWMTGWFKVLAGLTLAGALAGSVRFFSTRKLKEKLRELERARALQEERERISRDLHDSVGAQLSTIISGLELASRHDQLNPRATNEHLIASLKDDARLTMAQLRETIWALSSSSMTLTEFCHSLEAYAKKQLSLANMPRLHCSFDDSPGVTLSPMQVLHLFRIAQEALTNALKHAHADHIWLTIGSSRRLLDATGRVNDDSESGGFLTMTIRDDGKGKSQPGADAFSGRGLANMERRARELRGKFTFEQDCGTKVEIVIPLEEKYLE